jgi:hypothetical protein
MKSRRQRRLASALPARKLSGKPPRTPEPVERFAAHLGHVEGRKLDEGDPAGQALAGLGEQVDCG